MKKRTLSLLLALLLCIMVPAGCAAPAAEPEGASTVEAVETPAPAQPETRTYTATAAGFGGDVTVTITVTDGSLTDVQAEGVSETEGVGSRAIEQLPAAILEAGSPDVDAVTGATISSTAVKSAARAAMEEAGLIEGSAAEAKMAPGVYTGSAYGFSLCRKITAEVTVDESKFLSIYVDTSDTGDTKHMLQSVLDYLVPRMIEHQSIAVDSITGATASSAGVKGAVAEALAKALQAGGSAPEAIEAFRTIPEKEGRSGALETEVLVVGMGGSGTAAAVSAAENGLDVLAIDKMAKYGGTTSLTGEMLAVNPPNHIAAHNNGQDWVDKEAMRAAWYEYTEGDAKEEMIDLLLDHSGEALDWLDERGFDFSPVALGGLAGDPWLTRIEFYPFTVDVATAYITEYFDALYENFQSNGGEYLLETEAYELLTDGNGAVTGVKARNSATGREYEIHAKAVVLATGGFAGNGEMTTRYLSDEYYDLKGKWSVYGLKTNDGKMIQAALDIGAAPYNIGMAPMVHNAGTPAFLSGFEVHETDQIGLRNNAQPVVWSEGDAPLYMSVAQNCVAVSKHGRRFNSEETIAMFDPWIAGPEFYSIWSTEQIESIRDNGMSAIPQGALTIYLGFQGAIPQDVPLPNIFDVLEAGIEAGFIYKADTLEDLAAQAGIDADNLVKTIADYNGYCETGVDLEFGKSAQFLNKIGEGPYYCIVGTPYCYTTCGGLDVNTDFAVLNTEGQPIEGLYAVGTDCMGVLFTEKKAYVTYGGAANGWGLTSGMLVGRSLASALGAAVEPAA